MTELEIEERLADALIILSEIEADDNTKPAVDEGLQATLRIAQFALQSHMTPGGRAERRVREAGGLWFTQ